MLLPGDADLAAAVTEETRRPYARLLIDWDGDGSFDHQYSDVSEWIVSVDTERASTTDLPAAVSLVSGLSGASIDFTLKQPAYDVLDLWDQTSVLFGRPLVTVGVRLSLGFRTRVGPREVRVFTGYLRSLEGDAASRTVKLTALDPAERLRESITLPDYAMFTGDYVVSHQPWTVNSQWIIDYVLRKNGIYASPPPASNAVISATGHGGLISEVGFNRLVRGVGPFQADPWVEGPWPGTLAPPGSWQLANYQEFFAEQEFQVVPGVGIGCCAWVYFGSGMTEPDVTAATKRVWIQVHPDSDQGRLMNVLLGSDGKIYADIQITGTAYSTSGKLCGPVGWRYVGLHWKYNVAGDWTITVRVDGTTTTETISAAAFSGKWEPALQTTMWLPRPWTNFQVWIDPTPPVAWPGETHTSQADLARGRAAVSHLPTVVNQESLSLISDVVEAEFALFGFDEQGRAFFKPQVLSQDTNTVVATLSTTRSIKELSSGVSSDTVVNSVGWNAEPRFFSDTWAAAKAVIRATDVHQFDVTAGTSRFRLPIPSGYVIEPHTVPRYTSASWLTLDADEDTIVSGYAAMYYGGVPTEVPNDGSLTLTFRQVSETEGILTVVNTSNIPVQFQTLDPGGRPALRIFGRPLESDGVVRAGREENLGSKSVYGVRSFSLDSSQWRTDPIAVQELAAALSAQLGSPIPVVDDIPIVGDPRLQLGDLVKIHAIDREFRVRLIKIQHHFSVTDGLTTTVSGRPIAPPGIGVWDDSVLGIWDSTLVWGP